MARHWCPRCGYESRRALGGWADRHPVAAVLFALPAGYSLVGVMLVYPWFTIPVTIIVSAFLVDRRQRRRAAIAARADYEHRELAALAIFNPEPPAVEPQKRPPRRCGADHWSPTKPIRQRT